MSFVSEWTFPDSSYNRAVFDFEQNSLCIGNLASFHLINISTIDSLYEFNIINDTILTGLFIHDTVISVNKGTEIAFYDLEDTVLTQIDSTQVVFSRDMKIVDSVLCLINDNRISLYRMTNDYTLTPIDSLSWNGSEIGSDGVLMTEDKIITLTSDYHKYTMELKSFKYSLDDTLEYLQKYKRSNYCTDFAMINDSLFSLCFFGRSPDFIKITEDTIYALSPDTLITCNNMPANCMYFWIDHLFLGSASIVYSLNISNLDSIYCDGFYYDDEVEFLDLFVQDSLIYTYCRPYSKSDSLKLKVFKYF